MAAAAGDGQDNDLDELLDSALDDFDKPKLPAAPPGGEGVSDATPSPAAASAGDSEKRPPLFEDQQFFEALFEGELANQARDEFDKAMKELAQEEPQLVEQFQRLSEAAGKVGSDASSQREFTHCLKDTLSGLAKNADDLQSSGLAGEDLAHTLQGLGLDEGIGAGEGGGEDANILPIMHSIMQNLLSKEVLYPSLKEITEKYPDWLSCHRESLPPGEFKRFEEQHRLMGEICRQFESAGGEQSQFESVLELMQKLQDLGHPPKELAGETPPGLNFDLDGLNLPGAGGGEQCAVM
ncbi:peroxisomal biogenesis factor 19 [Acipenser ruthenus]|uniref:peroxisomal biogenesis factor 19 n=1 Tax=Acipenser ruthenus TaxID=7906 RepID=UPI0027424896|nr:peroxisomal biogenesis factor 19 [Acipenser ruthenus]